MSWNDNPYLRTAEPGLDAELRRTGELMLTPSGGVFGRLRVSYLGTSNMASFDTRYQFITVQQMDHAQVGPLTFRIPWGNAGIERAVRTAVVAGTTHPTSFRTGSGQELLFRSR